MPRLALTGGAYQSRSVIASAQRCLNLVPEPMPQAQGEPSPAAHYPTPGLRLLGTVGSGPIRGIRQSTFGGVYVASGNSIYHVDPNTWTGTALGNVFNSGTPVSMQDNGITLAIVDGSPLGWTIDLGSNAWTQISDPAFYGADRVDVVDTFLIFNQPNTPHFYISGSLATTFDGTDIASKAIYPDNLVTLIVAKREIYLLGERTTEIWYDAGPTDTSGAFFQFAPIQSVFFDHGCRAKYSVATYDNSIYWVSYDRAGQGIVMAAGGYQTKRVSTYAIEAHLATMPRIDDAIGFVYSLGGHAFYVLAFPTADETWVYDITTGEWHEWKWIDVNGLEHRHRANCAYPVNGTVVVGDHENGNLYALDNSVFTDNGTPIKRQRAFPHVLNDAKRVFHRQFIADLDTGNPLPPPTVTTTIEQVITWPPEIASMTGFAGRTTIDGLPRPDWSRGLVYFFDLNSYDKFALTLTTQTAPIASLPVAAIIPNCAAVDPLSGDLLVQHGTPGTSNGEPIFKLDPNTFATIGTFGVATSFPSYPSSVWVGDGLVCLICRGVSYGVHKPILGGAINVIRVDTMTHAGFSQNVVSGSYQGRGPICAGASGGNTATAFITWDTSSGMVPSVQLYVVTITAGAETYNPSTWPATNPHITAATVGTIPASAIDPTQGVVAMYSIGYDQADGNVLFHVGVAPSGGTSPALYYIVKVRATDAVVLWTVPISNLVDTNLEQSRINGSLWVWENSNTLGTAIRTSWRIDTILGTATTQPFGGTTNNLPGYPIYDSMNAVALYAGSFTAGTDCPVPVSGTSNFTADWALMGGATDTTISHVAADTSHRIFLDWSDDRGHSYGNPVGQSIGFTGEYRRSLQWQRLGYARDRVFRLTWSVPVQTALQGAWISVEPGDAGT